MSKHRMTAWAPFGLQPDSLECVIEYLFTPGSPDVMYLRNGDPGYPGYPPEVGLISVKCVHPLDEAMQKMLTEWAIEHLASDDGFTDAVEIAHDAADRDYDRGLDAYERREA